MKQNCIPHHNFWKILLKLLVGDNWPSIPLDIQCILNEVLCLCISSVTALRFIRRYFKGSPIITIATIKPWDATTYRWWGRYVAQKDGDKKRSSREGMLLSGFIVVLVHIIYTLTHREKDRDISAYSRGRCLSSRTQLVCFLTRSKRNTGIDA